jgi:nucleoside-diphosphate-sugar epimerase
VPFSGTNLVSLSHVEDLACMMAAAVGKPQAIGQAFNLTSDTPLTHAGIAKCIAKVAGKEAKVRGLA